MSGFYRFGKPGEDCVVHVKTARSCSAERCASPRFPDDSPKGGSRCNRMAVALCDATGCDAPMCDLHRTADQLRPNTDFCPEHKDIAEKRRASC